MNDHVEARLPPGLLARLCALHPGGRVVSAVPLGVDEAGGAGETAKGLGYGRPIRLTLEEEGARRDLVLHTATPDAFGHDRRSDRVAAMLLAWDTFGALPRHARAVDVGVIAGPELVSLAGAGEAYLLTEWAAGRPYAVDLRRVAAHGATEDDVERARRLARLLAEIHARPGTHPGAYVRAWRDLCGSGEGIAGIADGYTGGAGRDVPGAPAARIAAIERRCLALRHRFRDDVARLTRTHGDFHPFNVLFDGGEPVLLDASRGAEGEPADDVACMAINFLFFGVGAPERWAHGLGRLWAAFLSAYDDARPDPGLPERLAPFFAWRGLVVTSPAWYPNLEAHERDRILRFVERCLEAPRFTPGLGEDAMR